MRTGRSGFPDMSIVVKGLLKSIAVILVLAACVAAGSWFERLGLGGVPLTLGVILVLVFMAAIVWAYYVPWSLPEFLVSLCPIPVAVLFAVAQFSGFKGPELMHPYNLYFVAVIFPGLVVPWVAGTVLGWRMEQRRRVQR